MMKKELGLFLLLAVISAITGAINPAYLSFVNLLNMANLIGLFGVFALGEGLVIIPEASIFRSARCSRCLASYSSTC